MSAPLSAEDVTRVTAALAARGVRFAVDRGFGVDALVGALTREHRDLDLLVAPGALDATLEVLAGLGFVEPRPTARGGAECTNAKGQQVDVREDAAVLAPGFVSTGSLGGVTLPCVSATHQLARRAAARIRDNDLAAIELLHQRLGVPLPAGLPPLALVRARLALRRFVRRLLGRR